MTMSLIGFQRWTPKVWNINAVLADSNPPHQEERSGRTTPLKRQTSVLKPSESFIRSFFDVR